MRQLTRYTLFSFAALAVTSTFQSVAFAQVYTSVNFTKNRNMQTDLDSAFPVGNFTANNTFATPFLLDSDNSGRNYFNTLYQAGSNPRGLDIPVNIFGVTQAYTLINNLYGAVGPTSYASVEFIGSAGADQKFNLIGNRDIRDFFNGSFTTLINGTSTKNAFQITNTGNAGGNPTFGTYRLDEQQFILAPAFATQTLVDIRWADNGATNVQRTFLAGVTVFTPAITPEPGVLSFLAGMLVTGGLMLCRRQKLVKEAADKTNQFLSDKGMAQSLHRRP